MVMKPDRMEGGALRVSASIADDYASSVAALMRKMHADVIRGVRGLYAAYAQDDADFPNGGSIAPQARMLINRLLQTYAPLFRKLAKRATDRMMSRVLKNSSATLRMSLREIGEHLAIKTDFMDDRLRDITMACTEEAANLIRTIPQNYLSDVQGAVMRSISEGRGIADLVPYLNQRYQGNLKKARSVAFDQTRKAYNNITAGRSQALGMQEFEWIHSGGGKEPRKDHMAMHGKVYRFDDPPVVAVMYGREVKGLPGTAINCRCVMKPIVNFKALIAQKEAA